MNRHKRYPPEVRERAVRLVLEQFRPLSAVSGRAGPNRITPISDLNDRPRVAMA